MGPPRPSRQAGQDRRNPLEGGNEFAFFAFECSCLLDNTIVVDTAVIVFFF